MTTFLIHKLIKQFTRHPFRTIIIILSPELILVGLVYVILMVVLGGGSSEQQSGCSSNSDDTTGSITGTDGDWTKKGTRNYNGAKAMFSALKSKGANDTQAAGVIGALAHEAGGAFGVPDIAQGFYTWTSNPTEANAGISSPGVASKAAGATAGGASKVGASMFQYTPYTKYAPASDKSKWRSYPDLISYWFKTQVPGQGQSISGLKKCSSLSEAVHWTLQVEEGGGSSDAFSDRLSKAHQAYSAFSGVGGTAGDADTGSTSGSSSCGSDDSGSASDVFNVIKRYLGLKYQLGGDPTPIAEGKPKSEVSPTDCNKFVWGVFRQAGYAVPSTVPGNCDDSIQRLHKYEVSASQTRKGTILITHDHAMIMMEKWHGMSTEVAQEGGGGGDVNEGHTYKWSMASVLGDTRHYFNVPKR